MRNTVSVLSPADVPTLTTANVSADVPTDYDPRIVLLSRSSDSLLKELTLLSRTAKEVKARTAAILNELHERDEFIKNLKGRDPSTILLTSKL